MFNNQRREREISSKNIFYLVNESNVGDSNTAKAIAISLEKSLLTFGEKVSITEISANDIMNIESTYTVNEDFIFIGSGAHNLSPLATLSHTSAITIWTCHQLHSNALEIINKITLAAIPEHEATEEIERKLDSTTLVKTVGVAHGRCESEVIAAYNNSEIPKSSNYNLLVLGGDAPNKDGKIKCFSQDAAAAISKYVDLSTCADTVNLLTNCHRTGKHDPNSFECINRHTQDDEVDFVTRRALDSFSNEKNLLFYDFKTGSNYYLALLGAICKQEESLIFIPGESTSMISEVISLLPASRIYIYDTDSMNESHHLHINSIKSNLGVNHLKLIDNRYELSHVDESVSPTKLHYNTCEHIINLALPIITGNKLNQEEQNDLITKRGQI